MLQFVMNKKLHRDKIKKAFLDLGYEANEDEITEAEESIIGIINRGENVEEYFEVEMQEEALMKRYMPV